MQMAIDRRFRIVQLDECYVTRNVIPRTAWSMKKQSIQLDNKELELDIKVIAAAVSREYGLDHIDVFEKSMTKINFKIFLEGIRRKFPFENIILLMD